MDARSLLLLVLAFSAWCTTGTAQVFVGPRSSVQTPNFRVYAKNSQFASEVARSAEECRKQLAMHWLGTELPNWPEPCSLVVNDSPTTPASGETKYTLVGGGVANFQMSVSGTRERIIDSVLPHEITHTVMASHFAVLGKPVPRWADEGSCTTVEHQSERSKHDVMLVRYLGEGRGIPFATLFTLKDYPHDMMPLYAQGYSLSCFLISQGGPRRFIQFLERGMEADNWVAATDEFYQYPRLGKLQSAWNRWVSDGGGIVDNYTADSIGVSTRAIAANAQNTNSLSSRDTGVRAALAIQSVPSLTQRVTNVGSQVSNPVQLAVANSQTTNALNKSMDTSSGSYYLDEFRLRQQISTQSRNNAVSDSFVPTAAQVTNGSSSPIPLRLGQQAPFQTIGGGYIQR